MSDPDPDSPSESPDGAALRSSRARAASAPPPATVQSCLRKHWIEVVLVDDEGQPLKGLNYTIETPDGVVHSGALDDNGSARIEGIPAGQCEVTVTDLEELGPRD